jgi:spore maturation protein CgeB
VRIAYLPTGLDGPSRPHAALDAAVLRALKALGHTVRETTPEKARIDAGASDLLLALHGAQLKDMDLSELPSALWLCEDPYEFSESRHVRLLFTNEKAAVARYGRPVTYLPFAFDDLAPLPEPAGTSWDLCLIGRAFPRRLIVLQAIQDVLKRHRTVVAGPGWGGKLDPAIRVLDGWMPPREVGSLWRASKVVLQIHRDHFYENPKRIPPVTPAKRVFEAAGLGCCQVVDAGRPETAALYAEGSEYLAFESTAELAGIVETLLADPGKRRALGEAARARTLAQHTYRHRIAALLECCGKTLL